MRKERYGRIVIPKIFVEGWKVISSADEQAMTDILIASADRTPGARIVAGDATFEFSKDSDGNDVHTLVDLKNA